MTDLSKEIENLGEQIGDFGDHVEKLAGDTVVLTESVERSNGLALQTQKTLHRVSVLMVAKLATLILLAIALFLIVDLGKEIKSCTTPEGACTVRQTAATGPALDVLSAKNELSRIATELPIAERKGDGIRVEELKRQIPLQEAKIAQADQLRRDIQSGKIPVPRDN